MDAQELRNLQEAYLEVVENQQLDESFADRIDKQVKKNKEYSKKRKPVGASSFADRIDKQVEQRKKEKDRIKEEVDIYDIILSHLLDEGYAETPEAAQVIMVNMSEEWRESICEELTGERKKRALEKGTPLANRVARAKEGQPRERTGPPYLGATKKAPIKRGGIGDRGRGKSEWTGYESDRGSGNKAARRAGIKVRDTSDEV